MSQITIRNIDPSIEAIIRKRAEAEHKSLSDVSRELIRKGLGWDDNSRKKRDLSGLAGTWTGEQCDSFDATQRQFEQIDDEIWR